MINTQIIKFKNYGRCLKISNSIIEAAVTLDVGPRIIYFGFKNGENMMNTQKDKFEPLMGEKFDEYYYPGAKWQNFGGHRLWITTESLPETYYPDCEPVSYTLTENGAVFTPKPQTENSVAHEIEITMENASAKMTVSHRVKNISSAVKNFGLWAITVAAEDGIEIIPTPTADTGLLPNRIISVWPYTDMTDPRIYFGKKYITVYQKDIKKNLKLGVNMDEGKAYYVKGGSVFCIEYDADHKNNVYPDFGVSFETYSSDFFTEIETLGKYTAVEPGDTLQHDEHWSMFIKPCDFDERNDDSIDAFLSALK